MRHGDKIKTENYTRREVEGKTTGEGDARVTHHYMDGLYADFQGYVWDGRWVCKTPWRTRSVGWLDSYSIVGKVDKAGAKWEAYSVNGDWIGSYTTKTKAAEACYRDGVTIEVAA